MSTIQDDQLRHFLSGSEEKEFGPRRFDVIAVPTMHDIAIELLRARAALRYYADGNSYALGNLSPVAARRLLPEYSDSVPGQTAG